MKANYNVTGNDRKAVVSKSFLPPVPPSAYMVPDASSYRYRRYGRIVCPLGRLDEMDSAGVFPAFAATGNHRRNDTAGRFVYAGF